MKPRDNHESPDFLKRLSPLLGAELEQFSACLQDKPSRGMRVNPLKVQPQELLSALPFAFEAVEWCPNGYLLRDGEELADMAGRHPYHHGGGYYLQEPSAMRPVELLAVKPGHRVLDLCAAPGGKSTQIGAALKNQGLLVANEVGGGRIKPLSENLDRLGISCCIITNSSAESLQAALPAWFDRVLIDAPCSGEGMFRRDQAVRADWSLDKSARCQDIQQQLLAAGAGLLRPGGLLVYSTCTFNHEENEAVIEAFTAAAPDFTVETVERYWPHRSAGEGQFAARLRKTSGSEGNTKPFPVSKPGRQSRALWQDFLTQHVNARQNLGQSLNVRGDWLYAIPEAAPLMRGVRIVRAGVLLGEVRGARFVPSHALSHQLPLHAFAHTRDLADEPDLAYRYLAGHPLPGFSSRDWTAVTWKSVVLGWGRDRQGVLKNHYPKGLRLLS